MNLILLCFQQLWKFKNFERLYLETSIMALEYFFHYSLQLLNNTSLKPYKIPEFWDIPNQPWCCIIIPSSFFYYFFHFPPTFLQKFWKRHFFFNCCYSYAVIHFSCQIHINVQYQPVSFLLGLHHYCKFILHTLTWNFVADFPLCIHSQILIRYTAASVLRSTTLSTPEGHWLTCAW